LPRWWRAFEPAFGVISEPTIAAFSGTHRRREIGLLLDAVHEMTEFRLVAVQPS
jgi:hypothetical protein